jgi:hypothetical protein
MHVKTVKKFYLDDKYDNDLTKKVKIKIDDHGERQVNSILTINHVTNKDIPVTPPIRTVINSESVGMASPYPTDKKSIFVSKKGTLDVLDDHFNHREI